MQNTNAQFDIAARLYENPKYGTTYGPGLRHQMIYNGSIEIKPGHLKYLVDFASFTVWERTALTSDDMACVNSQRSASPHTLFSWMQRYDVRNKTKQRVPGMAFVDLQASLLDICLADDTGSTDIMGTWQLPLRHCAASTRGLKVPDLIATNTDLNGW
jgi:hypothetical protein